MDYMYIYRYMICISCVHPPTTPNQSLNSSNTMKPSQPTPESAKDTVEAACKYRFYLERQEKEMDAWRRNQNLRIPMDIVYRCVCMYVCTYVWVYYM